MVRNAHAYLLAATILLVPAVGGAIVKHKGFSARMHAALADDGITSADIVDGTIACTDLSAEVIDGCPGSPAGGSEALNVFVDGFTQADKQLPSTPSSTDPAASIATLDLADGSYVVFASLQWAANPNTFSGIVSCKLVPPNQGTIASAEFIGSGVSSSTLSAQTVAVGPGTVDLRCTDEDPGSAATYHFLQLTAVRVGSLTSTKLP